MGKKFAWSYSRYSMHDKCPKKYDAVVNKGIKEDFSGPAVERGIAIHKLMEHFILKDIPTVPKEFSLIEAEMHNLREMGAKSELDLSVTRDWGPSHSRDWDNVWCRNKLDAYVFDGRVAHVIDLKTGRFYDSHAEQGHLYATAALSWFEAHGVEEVNVEMWYCDAESSLDAVATWHYDLGQLPEMQNLWKKRARRIEIAKTFPAKPSQNNCKFCHLNPKRGGSCADAWDN